MGTDQNTGQPATAPHLAGAIVLAIAIIAGLHFLNFRFVVATGVGG